VLPKVSAFYLPPGAFGRRHLSVKNDIGSRHRSDPGLTIAAGSRGNAMKFLRRRFLQFAAGAVAFPAASRIAIAQAYPARQVRIVVGFAAGGTNDIVARLIGQWLSERLHQPFIVENRPGANTILATEAVARAPADGYTLVTVGPSSAINESLYEKLNYNLNRDFAMVASLSHSSLALEINPSVPASTVPEFIAYAKANPGKLSMASFGTGSISHVAGELFKMTSGLDMVHVPYRGSAPMLLDLLGGRVQVAFDSLPASIEHIKSGKLRALAVTSPARASVMPDIPTMSEFLTGYEADTYFGLAAPKNTPTEIIELLNKEIAAGLENPKIKARLAELGGAPLVLSSAAFGKLMAGEVEKWGKVTRSANIKPE
jgi:tripartite-type tricarboxylate transporter receptor subunit TctC